MKDAGGIYVVNVQILIDIVGEVSQTVERFRLYVSILNLKSGITEYGAGYDNR